MHQPAQFLPLVFKKKIICFAFGCSSSSQWKTESHANPTAQHIDQ